MGNMACTLEQNTWKLTKLSKNECMDKGVFPIKIKLDSIKRCDSGRLILTTCGRDDFSTHWIYFGATLWSPLQAWQ